MALDTLRSREHNVALLERYGTLLTEHQREVLELHLGSDWSLAEIATRQKVSRSAVHDLIRRSVQLLEDSERRLEVLLKLSAASGLPLVAVGDVHVSDPAAAWTFQLEAAS